MLYRSDKLHMTVYKHLYGRQAAVCPVVLPSAKETEDRKDTLVKKFGTPATVGSNMADGFINFSEIVNSFTCILNYPCWVQ
jgi:hypothetical protein